jgi:alkanesulfonate monooxygenase SsuD/methylene tetrahydromethanopterin reductase-like flavin-dependent oxidoreductase (luciferase family)
MGKGVSPIEIGFYGVPNEEAQERYLEVREILLRGLTEETVDFRGSFFKLTRVPMIMRPYQKPHPELWYGLRTPQSAIWAAQNDVNVVTIGLAAVTRQMTDLYRQEWARLGKPAEKLPLMGVSRHIVVAETDTEARKIARAAYRCWRESFANLWVAHGVPVPMKDIYPPDWDDLQALGNGCAGAPETVRRYIEEEAQRGGINYFVGWFAFGDMTLAQVTHSMELFSARVMPAFAEGSTHNSAS